MPTLLGSLHGISALFFSCSRRRRIEVYLPFWIVTAGLVLSFVGSRTFRVSAFWSPSLQGEHVSPGGPLRCIAEPDSIVVVASEVLMLTLGAARHFAKAMSSTLAPPNKSHNRRHSVR